MVVEDFVGAAVSARYELIFAWASVLPSANRSFAPATIAKAAPVLWQAVVMLLMLFTFDATSMTA
jgi:hypothetical protein